jgi:hypothetical protein
MSSSKLLLALAMVTAFSFAQPVKAGRRPDAGPTYANGAVPVPDGGSTVMLLGAGLGALGLVRRFLKS